MKLIVTGATGYVGKEVIRQSLGRKEITSVIAVARKPVPLPDGLSNSADASKLHSVGIKDYEQYPDDVKKEFSGAGACIWTVGISPAKASTMDWDELKRVSETCTIAGMKAMYEAGPANPFRFLYVCGETAERDQTAARDATKKPGMREKYNMMRHIYDPTLLRNEKITIHGRRTHMQGECENQVLKFAAEHDGVEVAAARPAMIYAPGEFFKIYVLGPIARMIIGAPGIYTTDLANAMLDQVINGFEKDALQARDLVRLSQPSA